MTRTSVEHALLGQTIGAVYVEFLIVMVPLWAFFLSLVQLAFLAHANLVVKHAADAAARSAVVVLPDDPAEYGGEPKMTIDRGAVSLDSLPEALELFSAGVGLRPIPAALDPKLANLGRSRLNTIRLAAHVPLMALAPMRVGRDVAPTLHRSIGTPEKILSSLYYQPLAVAVTFPGLEGGVVEGPEITVRVTYAYQCTVPVARGLLCKRFSNLGSLGSFGQALLPSAQGFLGGRFKRLEHETTLLIHDAPYNYRPRSAS